MINKRTLITALALTLMVNTLSGVAEEFTKSGSIEGSVEENKRLEAEFKRKGVDPYLVGEPKWTDFCPSAYCDAKWNKPGFYYSPKEWFNNYWVVRRNEFEKAVSFCDRFKTPNVPETNQIQLAACYIHTNQTEINKNKEYDRMLAEQRELDNMILRDMLRDMRQNRPRSIQCQTFGSSINCVEY